MSGAQSAAAGSLLRRGGWLLAAWLACFLTALSATAVFVAGVARDERWGEPVLAIDLARAGDWRTMPFRIWSGGEYTLHLTTVNHDRTHIGAPLEADFAVRIVDPDGRVFFEQAFPAGTTKHRLPDNMHWTHLARFEFDAWRPRQWTLSARVQRGDPRFATGFSDVRLRKERYDPGMGGLINYVMIIPAGLFTLIAFALALKLAGSRRVPAPLVLSGLLLLGLAALAVA